MAFLSIITYFSLQLLFHFFMHFHHHFMHFLNGIMGFFNPFVYQSLGESKINQKIAGSKNFPAAHMVIVKIYPGICYDAVLPLAARRDII